jgi:histidinol phosphatase-like enzyme
MILKALKKYKLSSNECIMIGDKGSDMLAAKKSNIEFEYKSTKPLDMQVKKFFNRINNIKKK